jgi:cell division protease FtsH
MMECGYDEAKELLEQHRQEVEDITRALLRYETLDAEEVETLRRGEELNRPDEIVDTVTISDQAESADMDEELDESDESDESEEETGSDEHAEETGTEEPAEAAAESIAGNDETKSD